MILLIECLLLIFVTLYYVQEIFGINQLILKTLKKGVRFCGKTLFWGTIYLLCFFAYFIKKQFSLTDPSYELKELLLKSQEKAVMIVLEILNYDLYTWRGASTLIKWRTNDFVLGLEPFPKQLAKLSTYLFLITYIFISLATFVFCKANPKNEKLFDIINKQLR